jgi:hypothetical protein
MSKAIKYAEKAVVYAARGAWIVYDRLNRISQNPSFTPKWSDKPLLKSYEKEKPPLGWPRTTDSLCPKCVPEIRKQILDGKLPYEVLLNEKVGEVKAEIIERDAKSGWSRTAPSTATLKTSCRSTRPSPGTFRRTFPAATCVRTTTKRCAAMAARP